MSKVAIVYHSGYGHTAAVAKAVARGATGVADTTAQLIAVADIDKHWGDLAEADAIIFGAPTYMGSVSAPFKAFMDASSKVWFSQGWKDKIAAGFTHSGSQGGDKYNSSKGSNADLNRLGSSTGLLTQSNVDQGAEAIPASDLRTAEHLGRRVAEFALAREPVAA